AQPDTPPAVTAPGRRTARQSLARAADSETVCRGTTPAWRTLVFRARVTRGRRAHGRRAREDEPWNRAHRYRGSWPASAEAVTAARTPRVHRHSPGRPA